MEYTTKQFKRELKILKILEGTKHLNDFRRGKLEMAKWVENLILFGVNRSTKIKIDKPFRIKGINGRYIAEIRNVILENGDWDKEINFVKIE